MSYQVLRLALQSGVLLGVFHVLSSAVPYQVLCLIKCCALPVFSCPTSLSEQLPLRGRGGGGLEVRLSNFYLFIFVITITFFLTSVQVSLVSYCCLFCVLSNNMLNVSIGIFS